MFRFFADMNERMQTKVVGMPLENGFELTPQLLEDAIARQKNEGGNVKGFLYCNPNNPLGVVYPRQLTLDLMEVCKKHEVTLWGLCSEVGNSSYSDNTELKHTFQSKRR